MMIMVMTVITIIQQQIKICKCLFSVEDVSVLDEVFHQSGKDMFPIECEALAKIYLKFRM